MKNNIPNIIKDNESKIQESQNFKQDIKKLNTHTHTQKAPRHILATQKETEPILKATREKLEISHTKEQR